MAREKGERISLEITKVVHGGLGLGRHEGLVTFVPGTLPGEVVEATLREVKRSHAFADLQRVVSSSPHRVAHIWPEAEWTRPAARRPGGADFGHIDRDYQRQLKSEILRESLHRFGRASDDIAEAVTIQVVPGDLNGKHWRTRLTLHVDSEGRAGPFAEGSHTVIPVQSLPLAVRPLEALGAHHMDWSGHQRLRLVQPSVGEARLIIDDQAPQPIVEQVGEHHFSLTDQSFWQVHSQAPAVLTEAVSRALELAPWDRTRTHLDLYAGVGLFSWTLMEAGASAGNLYAVESDHLGATDLATNLREWPVAHAVHSDVTRFLTGLVADSGPPLGAVILDPPRRGARAEVVSLVAALQPDVVVYVACDPVALGRDVGVFAEHGYQLGWAEGFDLFPHTHHMETVALLVANQRRVFS